MYGEENIQNRNTTHYWQSMNEFEPYREIIKMISTTILIIIFIL